MATGVEIRGGSSGDGSSVLTRGALELVGELHEHFEERRRELLQARGVRACAIAGGANPVFLDETAAIRKEKWSVAEAPPDLDRRWAEITGPVDRKMMINALNSGANVFMADLEDALSPSWNNVVQGQINLVDAVRKRIDFRNPDGREYTLNPEVATLLVRPRGWHLQEKHVHVHGEPTSASLFDFALYFFHNAKELLSRGTGPYFYLPKMESHLEARLWNDVFCYAQDALGIPRGTIRATVLIETILAAFEMEEILYELREHSSGLNAGRWDYIFSAIKKFAFREDLALPDRGQITMTVPFMRAYTELLVKTCHHRGAHAIGGMAAFIPSRRDEEVNRIALAKVREDKEREAADGFDGSWVAHPDLVPVCREVFERVLHGANNQKGRLREDVSISPQQIIDLTVPGGTLTEEGVRNNVSVGIQYLNSWLEGNGAAAINNLMEDAATAEISRAQLWQWVHREAKLDDGRTMTPQLYEQIRDEELDKIGGRHQGRVALATELLDRLVLAEEFQEFLTLDAYRHLG
jgi:malate synthase